MKAFARMATELFPFGADFSEWRQNNFDRSVVFESVAFSLNRQNYSV